jgi:hypothetical protein
MTTTTTMTDPGKGTHTTEAAAEAPAAIRGQKRRRDQPPASTEELLNVRCPRHTYLDKDGRQKPAHLLIKCREFLWLNQALQEKIRSEQPVAGAMAYNAPPPPPNPPPNATQHGHQAATIQHLIEPRQQVIEEEAFPPPRGFVPMIQRGARKITS